MSKCININTEEFRKLQKETGIHPLTLKSKIGVWMEDNNTLDFPSVEQLNIKQEDVQYSLKAVNLLLSDKAEQVFDKGNKNNWSLDKILTELAIPKEQKQLLLELGVTDREQLALDLSSKYGFSVEINTARGSVKRGASYNDEDGWQPDESADEYLPELKGNPTQFYSNLTVPGGTNYTENEISTPLITPSIKGHAQFATDKGIGWFRSDDKIKKGTEKEELWYGVASGEDGEIQNSYRTKEEAEKAINKLNKNLDEYTPRYFISTERKYEAEIKQIGESSNTRRILEVQSDLFQKGRDKNNLIAYNDNFDEYREREFSIEGKDYSTPGGGYFFENGETIERYKFIAAFRKFEDLQNLDNRDNQFLQLLNKNNNWVTFFIKSIIQDSAKKGYEKVLFPKGETAAKIEGHETLANLIISKDRQIKELTDEINIDSVNDIKDKSFLFLDNKGETVEIKHLSSGKWEVQYMTGDKAFNIVEPTDEQIIRGYKRKNNEKLAQLEQEKANLKSQGIEKLKPIEAFYEIKVGNILEKQFGKDNVKTITDEYGNQWREVDLSNEKVQEQTKNIEFQKDKDGNTKGFYNDLLNLIYISNLATIDTLPHEYAHHYIKMFRNTAIVQKAISLWGSEEELVQAIGEQVVKQKGEAYEFWKEFTKFVVSLFKFDKEGIKNYLTNTLLKNINLNELEVNDNLEFRDYAGNLAMSEESLQQSIEDNPELHDSLSKLFSKLYPNIKIITEENKKIINTIVDKNNFHLLSTDILANLFNLGLLERNNFTYLTGSLYFINKSDDKSALNFIKELNQKLKKDYNIEKDLLKIEDKGSNYKITIDEEVKREINNQNKNTTASLETNAKEISANIKKVAENVLNGLKNRYSALKRNPNITPDILDSIVKLRRDIESSTNVVGMAYFIEDLYKTIDEIENRLYKMSENRDTLNYKTLRQLKQDYLGFYTKYVNELKYIISEDVKNINIAKRNNLDYTPVFSEVNDNITFRRTIAKKGINKLPLEYLDEVLDTVVSKFGIFNGIYNDLLKSAFKNILSSKKNLINENEVDRLILDQSEVLDKDITSAAFFVQSSKSSSPLLRHFVNVIKNADLNTEKRTIVAVNNLRKVADDARKNGVHSYTDLMEYDRNGIPTGNYVRSLNYGQLKQDYDDFKIKLYDIINKKFNVKLEIDENPKNKTITREINRQKNEWLSKHVERKMTAEYYDIYADLSEEASEAIRTVDHKISDIYNKYRNKEGVIEYYKIKETDWKLIEYFEKEKTNLGNEFEGSERKVGIDLQIAKEIKALREKLKDDNTERDYSKYYEAEAKAKKELSKEDFEKWLSANNIEQYDEEYYDLLKDMERGIPVLAVYAVKYLKRKIMSQYKDKDGTPIAERMSKKDKDFIDLLDSAKFEEDYDSKETSVSNVEGVAVSYDQILNLLSPEELLEIRREISKHSKEAKNKKEGIKFKDVAKVVTTNEYNSLYKSMKLHAEELIAEGKSNEAEAFTLQWYRENHYINYEGKSVPHSYYTKIVPKNDKHIKRVPHYRWSTASKNSKFHNPNFKEELAENGWQPKKSLYNNEKNYNKVVNNKYKQKLLEELVNIIKTSNERMFGDNSNMSSHRMPQISGKKTEMLMYSGGPGKAIKNIFRELFIDTVDDEDINNTDVVESAEGSQIKFVPIKYIADLSDNRLLTRNLVASAVKYAEMSINYEEKHKILSELEILKDHIATNIKIKTKPTRFNRKKESKSGIESRLYDKMVKELEYGVYGNSESGGIFRKPLKRLKSLTNSILLMFNPLVAIRNTIQAKVNLETEKLLGRFIDRSSSRAATKDLAENAVDMLSDIMDNQKTNIVSKLLEYNGVNFKISETADKMSPLLFRRLANTAGWYFMHKIADMPFKTKAALSIYHFNRIYNGEVLSKYEFLNYYFKNNKKEGNKIWDSLEKLRDCYELDKDNNLKVKDKYKNIVTKEVETKITNTIRHLASRLDAMTEDQNKTSAQRNGFSSLVYVLRSWLSELGHQKFAKRGYNYDIMQMDEGVHTTVWRKGIETMGVMTKQKQLLDELGNTMNRMESVKHIWGDLEAYERYNIQRWSLEVGTVFVFGVGSSLLAAEAEDDDRKWLDYVAYLTRAMLFEFAYFFNPIEFWAIIKQPTAGVYPIDYAKKLIESFSDFNKSIQSGPYKGMTKGAQAAIKLTPVASIVGAKDPNAKRSYIERMYSGATGFFDWISISDDKESEEKIENVW